MSFISKHRASHLGSPIRLMVAEGVNAPSPLGEALAYDEFGVPLVGAGSPAGNPFGFTGYQSDSVSGLFYAQARYYTPTMGRFTAEDTIRDGSNWYHYCNNNPILFIDPWGLIPTPAEAAAMNDHIYNPYGEDGWLWPKVELTGGWAFIKDYEDGYYAGLYSRALEDGAVEYALVSKGTAPFTLRDWEQNVLQPFGKSDDMRKYLEFAAAKVCEFSGCEFTFIGHSKGGAEAAVATNQNCIVFNPATVFLNSYGLSSDTYSAKMTAYIVKNEPLNSAY